MGPATNWGWYMTYRLYIPKELLGLLIAAIDFDDVAQALERVEGQANVKCEIPLTLTRSFPLTLRYIRKDKGFLLENRGGATCDRAHTIDGQGQRVPPQRQRPLLANIYSAQSTCQSKAARTLQWWPGF